MKNFKKDIAVLVVFLMSMLIASASYASELKVVVKEISNFHPTTLEEAYNKPDSEITFSSFDKVFKHIEKNPGITNLHLVVLETENSAVEFVEYFLTHDENKLLFCGDMLDSNYDWQRSASVEYAYLDGKYIFCMFQLSPTNENVVIIDGIVREPTPEQYISSLWGLKHYLHQTN